ncbi:ParB N-terminal domain-containing protein [Leptospira interrogans]|uniref:ParB N-terminal domain-containing protein n=1 Tax=Leptospira interrogans TaxID=173 RepID=UPI0002BD4483|nr:ParB N-terminal domain-containing protein [Leptospira interrogans]EMN56171.1 ParB-like protein [Leptospira interrogans serovar Autumnalis str. LP101]WOT10915.1 ParB N-terminal domain-containing protein [Leptospira interrogans]WOT10933.1 ParB N-terminal domain-containing protein [Leptospira interrogans]WOT13169.1 ParB N-terminal domain-containing protein [Leptospira interrogans]
MKVGGNTKGPKKETSTKVSLEEKAKEWMEAQETIPRPGSTFKKQYIPKGVTLSPIVKMVKPESLRPNPRNDFDHLSEDEYESLKENIALNGILDALTARKDGTIVTGENRYRIALELQKHEDENVRRRVENIPVRHYMNELTFEEEYDILEGDNLFRRHLTSEQRKERLKKRILRKYKDELVQDNRGGDRKSDSLKEEEKSKDDPHLLIEEETKQEVFSSPEKQTESAMELGLFQGEVGTLEEQAQEKEGVEQGSKQESEGLKNSNSFTEEAKSGSSYQGDSLKTGSEKSKVQGELLIGDSGKDLAKKVSEKENIPVGTAKKYIAEIRKELKSKEPKSVGKEEKEKESKKAVSRNVLRKEKAKQFQKKYAKLTHSGKQKEVDNLVSKVIRLRKKWRKLNEEIGLLNEGEADLIEMLTVIGQTKRIHGLKV